MIETTAADAADEAPTHLGEAMSDEELRKPPASRLAVLGQPISHSKSPQIHAAVYEVLGLPWEYEAVELGEADLASFLESRGPEWRGFSLTMPLKEEARRIALVVDRVAEDSGVVNTLLRLTGSATGSPQWAGFNTDVAGLAAAIARAELDVSRVAVLGAGATAVSAVLAARSLGSSSIVVAARRLEAAQALARRFSGVEGEADADPPCVSALALDAPLRGANGDLPTLVISTLPGPAGVAAGLDTSTLGIPLFDVAYDPWPSPLALRWRDAGTEAHSGVDMLIEQALVQQRIFVNGDPDAALDDESSLLEAMRAAVASANMGG